MSDAFPIRLSVQALGEALDSRHPERFRAAVEAMAARGGLLLDGDTVALTAETAERLGLEERDGDWVTVDPEAETETREERRARLRDELRRMERRDAKRRKLGKPRAKAPKRKPAPAPRPKGNAFDLSALRRSLGA